MVPLQAHGVLHGTDAVAAAERRAAEAVVGSGWRQRLEDACSPEACELACQHMAAYHASRQLTAEEKLLRKVLSPFRAPFEPRTNAVMALGLSASGAEPDSRQVGSALQRMEAKAAKAARAWAPAGRNAAILQQIMAAGRQGCTAAWQRLLATAAALAAAPNSDDAVMVCTAAAAGVAKSLPTDVHAAFDDLWRRLTGIRSAGAGAASLQDGLGNPDAVHAFYSGIGQLGGSAGGKKTMHDRHGGG